jgi:hypothetical protein
MELTTERITPHKAQAWLNKNQSNRKLRTGIAERYADDMRNGKWTECPVPISFYEDGDVADGQHRLWAIIESGCTITFPVARGLSRDAGLNIDTGLGRTIVDNARIAGVEGGITAALASCARACEEGTQSSMRISNARRLDMVEKHRTACEWSISNVRHHRGLCGTVVTAAVARAWYIEGDKDRLALFCDILGTGRYGGSDSDLAPIAMRNYLLAKGPHASHQSEWRDTFMKVQNAIWYFMRQKKLMVVRTVQDEQYPLKKGKGK